jgi:hypothetical protein
MSADGQRKQKRKSIAVMRLAVVVRSAKTFGTLIDLHIDNMKEVGKAPDRERDIGNAAAEVGRASD